MKLFKKLFTATLIILIVLSMGGIIYVLLFQEDIPAIKEPAKKSTHITKKAAQAKTDKSKLLPGQSVPVREVAIIIDDIGYDLDVVKSLLKVNVPLTFAILPFQNLSREAAEMLHKAKKEILLHLPMEPVSYPQEKPGQGALFTDMNNEELLLQLQNNISAIPYIAGVNNHMGSKFMIHEPKLSLVFKELKRQKLFFIDSRTSNDTRALSVADKTGLNVAERKIFIDHHRNYSDIYNNLMNVANSDNDFPKIMIGHPYPETVRALKDAAKKMQEQGVSIVPASQIIKKQKNFKERSSLSHG